MTTGGRRLAPTQIASTKPTLNAATHSQGTLFRLAGFFSSLLELVPASCNAARGRLTATVTHVWTFNCVAKILGADPELLEAIVYNDDNLSYCSIISAYTGLEDTITALTDDGIDELKDMIRDARITTETLHAFLDDAELGARIKAQSPR